MRQLLQSPSLALLALLLFAPLVLWSCGGSGEHAKLDEGQSGPVAATGSDGAPAAEMSSSPEPVLQDMEVEESFELGRRARPAANTAGAAIDEQRQAEGSTDKAEKSAAKKTPSQTWKRSQVLPHQSRLEVGDKEELPQEALQVKVRVDGFRARVLLDGYYRNDRAEQLEGTFQLRLPSGATPWYLAFGKIERKAAEPVVIGDVLYSAEEARRMGLMPEDVLADRAERWSEPKEAKMLPRRKAAHAYGETVRRRVDPALMEWSGAGVFTTRVFPLEPGQLHRIVLGYDVDLTQVGEDWLYALDLPSGDMRRTVDIEVARYSGMTPTLSLDATPQEGEDALYWRFDDPETRRIELRLSGPRNIALTGLDPKTSPYFAARFSPDFPAEESKSSLNEAVFLLDTSLSASPNAYRVQRQLLLTILEQNQDRIARFNVLFFDVGARWWKQSWADNDAATRNALEEATGDLSLEGATDLGAALAEAARPSFLPMTELIRFPVFLLSDGAATWGESAAHQLTRTLASSDSVSALFAYRTGLSGTDTRMLTRLTRDSGGALFSVTSEDQLVQAARAHRSAPWQIRSVSCDVTSDLMLAGRPTAIYPGQSLTLVGRGHPKEGAEVVLQLQRGGETREVRTPLAVRLSSELCGRIYGQVATQSLEDYSWALQDEAEVYASYFRVAGPSCSLLMLESEEDYARFGIRPENHAFVVQKAPASNLLAKAEKEFAGRLADAKAEFAAMLEDLSEAPGMRFKLPQDVQLLIDSLEVKDFYVESKPLTPQLVQARDVSGRLSEQLASRQLDYDTVTAEAQARFDKAGAADAIRALSSLIENRPGDLVLLRDVAYSTEAWGRGDKAYHLLRTLAEKRPFEPINWLGIARCLRSMQERELALLYYEICLAGEWDGRFGEFRKIATTEYLHFLRELIGSETPSPALDFARTRVGGIAKEIGLTRADLLVVIEWNTDNSDVDLHVWEPTGEHCFYSHRETKIGGRLTTDVTQGYGPEMYVLPRAQHGKYRVAAKYFARQRNRASARSKVLVTIYEDWGGKYEKVTRKTVTLAGNKEMHDVAEILIQK
jgi:tetratricopeptide (TPR) repeat protein